MSRSAQVEFVHEGERYRAEVEYDRVRHPVNKCPECSRAETAVSVSALVVRIWGGTAAIPTSDERFTELAQAAKAAFEGSPIYREALADAGPL